jgi:hypothetical protein
MSPWTTTCHQRVTQLITECVGILAVGWPRVRRAARTPCWRRLPAAVAGLAVVQRHDSNAVDAPVEPNGQLISPATTRSTAVGPHGPPESVVPPVAGWPTRRGATTTGRRRTLTMLSLRAESTPAAIVVTGVCYREMLMANA